MVKLFEDIALISLSILSVIISIYLGIELIKDIIERFKGGKNE